MEYFGGNFHQQSRQRNERANNKPCWKQRRKKSAKHWNISLNLRAHSAQKHPPIKLRKLLHYLRYGRSTNPNEACNERPKSK